MKRLRLAWLLCRAPRLPGRVARALRALSPALAACDLMLGAGVLLASLMAPHGGRLGDGLLPGSLPLDAAPLAVGLLASLCNLWSGERLLPWVAPEAARKARWALPVCALTGALLFLALISYAPASGGIARVDVGLAVFAWLSFSCAPYLLASSLALGAGLNRHRDSPLSQASLNEAQTRSAALIERQRLLIASSRRALPKATARSRL